MPYMVKLLKQYLQKKFGEDPELTLLKQQLAEWEKSKKTFKI